MSGTDSPISDEMLSAYLDGELPTKEVAEVEAALKKSEDLRTLLADLKLVRDEIRQLPRHTLSKDFASKIAAKAVTQSNNAAREPVTPKPDAISSVAKKSRSRMRLTTAVAGVAATLLIGLFAINMQQNGGPWVAATDTAARAPSGGMPQTDSEFTVEGMGRDLEEQFDDDAFGFNEQAPSDAMNLSQSRQASPQSMAPKAMQFETMPGDVKPQKLEADRASSFDAIVRFDSASQPAFGIATESLPEPTASPNAYSELQEADISPAGKESLLQQQLAAQGVTVPPGLRPVLVEGTRADVTQALARYGTPSNVQLFGNYTDASQLGLPTLDSVTLNRSRLMKRQSAGATTAAAPAPATALATAASDKATSKFKADSVAGKSVAADSQRERAPQRYRVLLFVKP